MTEHPPEPAPPSASTAPDWAAADPVDEPTEAIDPVEGAVDDPADPVDGTAATGATSQHEAAPEPTAADADPVESSHAAGAASADQTGAAPVDRRDGDDDDADDDDGDEDIAPDGGAAAEPVDAVPAGDAGSRRGGSAGAEGPPEVKRLAAAVAELDELGRLPVPEHVARYDALHGELSEALASIDEV